MTYRKGYYRKDGTYVEGYHTNQSGKNNGNINSVTFGCFAFILITIILFVIWVYTRDDKPLEFNIKNNRTVRIINDSTIKSQNNIVLIKDTTVYNKISKSVYSQTKLKFLNKIGFNKDSTKIYYSVFYENDTLLVEAIRLHPFKK